MPGARQRPHRVPFGRKRRLVAPATPVAVGRGALALAAALLAWRACQPAPAQARDGADRGRRRTRPGGRHLLFDGPGGAGPAAPGLYRGAELARVILTPSAKGVNGKIAVTYVEWAGSRQPGGRRRLDDHRRHGERRRSSPPALQAKPIRRLYRTSISGALDFAVPLFEKNDYRGLKRVIDVSGDGSNNQGRPVTRRGTTRWRRASPSTACRSC